MPGVLALVVIAGGCSRLQSVVPAGPTWMPAGPGGLTEITAWVEPVVLDADDEVDPAVADQLRWAFASYVRFAAQWAAVIKEPEELEAVRHAVPPRPGVRVAPRVVQRYSVRRTWVLDALSAVTIGYFPLSPSWGEVDVDLVVDVLDPAGRPLCDPVRVRVGASHGTLVLSAVRLDETEEAFRRAYDRAFADAAREVVRRVEDLVNSGVVLAAFAPSPNAVAHAGDVAPPAAVSATVTSSLARALASRADLAPTDHAWRVEAAKSALAAAAEHAARAAPTPIFLPPDGFDILTRPLARDDGSLLWRYLSALGGIEAATFTGGATVESRTRTANASDELVGAGDAQTSGYRFSFYRPPDRTGFFFPPSIGLLWEDITISGFREEVPLARSGDIPAIASDPDSGIPVDVSGALSYDLQLRSAFIGQGLGFDFVAGSDVVQLFITLQGHVNLLEMRYVDVTIGTTRVDGFSVTGVQSLGLGGQLGLTFPALHFAIRGSFTAEWFFDFDYPEPVEFQAAVRYNAEKDVFERERAFVTGASLRTYNAQIALAVVF